MSTKPGLPWGYHWRSSKTFVISTITIALFAETFLYGFLVPILGYMLEIRLGTDPSQTQHLTAALLTCHGFCSLVSAPVIGYFADKTPNRKIPLLISLATCFAGTILVACTPSLWALFLGRVLQGIAGSAAWILCFAALTDNVGFEHMGKVMGMAMSFVTAGIVGGPMVAGFLFQLVGYWPTWSAPLVLLVLDMSARLVMIEAKDGVGRSLESSEATQGLQPAISGTSTPTTASDPERAPLLSPGAHTDQAIQHHGSDNDSKAPIPPSSGFYRIMLRDTRVLAGIINTVLYSAVISGFDATLPLHLYNVFHWNSMEVALMFLCLQLPSIILGTFVGWLRDKTGSRKPATLGWLLLFPLFWLLGIPGQSDSEWFSPEANGKTIFIVCMIAIGTVLTLTRGSGGMQMRAVVHEKQTENPTIFGPHGGSSRIFSMSEISFSIGIMLGPMLSGTLTASIGYYYMNVTLGALCLIVAVISFCFFDDK